MLEKLKEKFAAAQLALGIKPLRHEFTGRINYSGIRFIKDEKVSWTIEMRNPQDERVRVEGRTPVSHPLEIPLDKEKDITIYAEKSFRPGKTFKAQSANIVSANELKL